MVSLILGTKRYLKRFSSALMVTFHVSSKLTTAGGQYTYHGKIYYYSYKNAEKVS